jgi:hypothetical protein
MTAVVVLVLVAGACILLALLAWRRARRIAMRLEELTQSYWQLRYEVEELRLQVQRRSVPGPSAESAPRQSAGQAFVPLASLKR